MPFHEQQMSNPSYVVRDKFFVPPAARLTSINHVTGVPDPYERTVPVPASIETLTESRAEVQAIGSVALSTETE